MNLSSTNDVSIGLGESAISYAYPPYGNEYAYTGIEAVDSSATGPAPIVGELQRSRFI
jgi:hypothetical protein